MIPAHTSHVYFFRPIGADGPIKIGFSAMPAHRLRNYLEWSPVPLEIVATIAGASELEQRFHAAFADDRTHHEWFRISPDLQRTLDEINAGRFDVASLPAPRRITSPNVRDELSRLVSSLAMRLNAVVDRGVTVPDHVWAAQDRFRRRPARVGYPRDPADAAIVSQFLDGLKEGRA